MVLEGKWSWVDISENIPISDVYRYPYEKWDRTGLSLNKDISIDIIHNLVLPNTTNDWDWYWISENIEVLDVYKHPYETWDRYGLSCNKDLSIDDIYRLDLRMRYDYRQYTISFSDITII